MRLVLGDNRPRIEQHGATADLGELVFDLEVVHHRLLGDDLFPASVRSAGISHWPSPKCRAAALRLLAVDLERLVEGAAGGDDAKVLVQHQQRLAHGVDDGLRERRLSRMPRMGRGH